MNRLFARPLARPTTLGHTSLMRLFVAVDVPEPVKALLADLPRPTVASVAWTGPAQWHVTLHFLGEVAPSRVEGPGGLVAALDAVPASLAEGTGPLPVQLGPAVAWFPGRRVLQIPVHGLESLAAAVARVTANWSASDPPGQRFRGHVTVARVRGQVRGPLSLAGARVSASWLVGEFVLYSSRLGPGGSRYDALHRVTLSA